MDLLKNKYLRITMLIVIIHLVMSFVTFNHASAKGFGFKGGWAMMQDDYDTAKYDDTYTLGVFFDMGTFLFENFKFKPGLDYVKLENDTRSQDLSIWGIHLDWYWNFLGKKKFSPFLGFGAALNYKNDNDNSTDDDSDSGFEIFLGLDIELTGEIALLIEGRFATNDIANFDENMSKLYGGISFKL